MSTPPAPVRALRNQYRGVNAHLHSFWQATGTWGRFHNAHIAHLAEVLVARLLPMGYVAEMEDSIQVRRHDVGPSRPRADILIRDTRPDRAPTPATGSTTAAIPLAEIADLEESGVGRYSAIALRPWSPDGQLGDIAAWVELLSPANKGDSGDAYAYIAKRRLLLEEGVVFVEIDYLHATPPTFARLPDYTRGEPGAHPYRVVVVDPRPDYFEARAYLHEFDVDAPLPTVEIPLNAGDLVAVDFAALYAITFDRLGYGFSLDYAQPPLDFARYSPADQARIARRMLAVVEAARAGRDLDALDAPLPVSDLPLDAALAALDALRPE